MTIDTKSWHYRWYTYWLREGRGTKPGYRENLCHYVRVLLFWAPATWIDQHTVWDWKIWTGRVLVVGIALYLVGAIALGLILVAVTQTTKFLLGIGSFTALLACIGLLILSIRTMQGRTLEVPGTVKLAGGYVMAKKRRICPFITFEDGASA